MLYTYLNQLIVVLNFGALILLTFLSLLNPLRVNKKGNLSFAFFLLIYASFWLEEVVVITGFGEANKLLLTLVHSIQITIPLVFYTSNVYYTQPDYTPQKRDLLHLILPLFYFIFQILIYHKVAFKEELRIISIIFILTQSVFYSVLSYIVIRKHQKRILQYSSDTSGISLNWLEYIIIQIIILSLLFVVYNIFVSTTDLSIYMNAIQLVTVYFIAFHLFRQKEFFPLKEKQRKDLIQATSDAEDDNANRKKIISDKDLQTYKTTLIQLMYNQQPYLECDINLVGLAEMLSVTPHQLSYIINAGFEENFFQFINRYRVEKAKELLMNADERMTILAIAYDSGFSSKTTFNTTFKKITHQTPSEFKKKH